MFLCLDQPCQMFLIGSKRTLAAAVEVAITEIARSPISLYCYYNFSVAIVCDCYRHSQGISRSNHSDSSTADTCLHQFLEVPLPKALEQDSWKSDLSRIVADRHQ